MIDKDKNQATSIGKKRMCVVKLGDIWNEARIVCTAYTHNSLASVVMCDDAKHHDTGKQVPYFSLVGHDLQRTILGLLNLYYGVAARWVVGKMVDGWAHVAESQFVSQEQSQQHVPETAP